MKLNVADRQTLRNKGQNFMCMKFSPQKRENAKRENDFRVFNFTLKFQKREFKIQKKFTS